MQCTNSGAIGGAADMPQAPRGRGADANDSDPDIGLLARQQLSLGFSGQLGPAPRAG